MLKASDSEDAVLGFRGDHVPLLFMRLLSKGCLLMGRIVLRVKQRDGLRSILSSLT